MAERSIDVLMKVVGASGALDAESNTTFATMQITDGLRDGFVAGKFCELQEFGFSAGVEASMSKDKKDDAKPEDEAKAAADKKRDKASEREGQVMTEMQRAMERQRKIQKIQKSQIAKSTKHLDKDFVDMQPVEFTRVMDAMSPLLFQSMVNCDTLESISVVKRKATGSRNSGDCYLRLDFDKVLITTMDWKDGEHIIIESGRFIYRQVTIRYRPQKMDGTLGAVIQSQWKMTPAGQSG